METLLLYLMDLNPWFHSGKPATHPLMEPPPPPLSPSSPKSQRYGFQSNIRIYYVVDGDWLSPTKFSKNKWQTLV